MKTSNKILLGLLVVVFTVPFLLAYSIKGKIKKGEYTIEKYENTRDRGMLHLGSFSAFKVVNVIAPVPDLLICHLRQSNDMSYRYYKGESSDSVIVFSSNDTLHIKYVTEKMINGGGNRQYGGNIVVNVDLPAFTNLVVDGAVVVLDSVPAASTNLSVILKNHGVIKDGSKNRNVENPITVPAAVIQQQDVFQVPQKSGEPVISESDRWKFQSIANVRFEIPDFDMKDFAVYRLF